MLLLSDDVRRHQAPEVEVASDDVVARDGVVVDGLVHRRGGEGVPFGGSDPSVEAGVIGPDGHDRRLTAAGPFARPLGEDAVGLAHGSSFADPALIPLTYRSGDVDGA